MLREAVGRNADGPGAVTPGGGISSLPRRTLAVADRLPGLVRRNWLFSAALVLSVVPRVVSMLGYQPAVLFKLDSFDYLWNATHLQPDAVNTSGYSLFLLALRPFHSLALVAGLQHALGLGVAIAIYAVLRRWHVIRWVAMLATVPVLFAVSEIFAEQLIMADFLALGLMVASFAVLLWQPRPSAPRCAWAGALMALSVLVRPTTLPLIALMAVYLLVRRAGWRGVSAVLAAGAVPIVAYMAWFASSSGSFNLTDSNGLFLWSRTMSFANCAVIKPPADLVALCPDRQPGFLNKPVAERPQPKYYLWDHSAWLWKGKPMTVAGVVPDKAAFTPAANTRAQQFAIQAIEAQPLAYLHVVGSQLIQPFVSDDTFLFELGQTHTSSLGIYNGRYALAAVRDYDGNLNGIGPYLGSHLGARLVSPWAHLTRGYQRVANLPAWLFGLIVLAGLAGILLPRRRNWPAALLWVSAVVALVVPVAEHDYTYRYALPTVPLFAMAVALCFGVAREQAARPAQPSVLTPAAATPAAAGGTTVPEAAMAPETAAAPETAQAAARPAANGPVPRTGPATPPAPPSRRGSGPVPNARNGSQAHGAAAGAGEPRTKH